MAEAVRKGRRTAPTPQRQTLARPPLAKAFQADTSTLREPGHFYFALTDLCPRDCIRPMVVAGALLLIRRRGVTGRLLEKTGRRSEDPCDEPRRESRGPCLGCLEQCGRGRCRRCLEIFGIFFAYGFDNGRFMGYNVEFCFLDLEGRGVVNAGRESEAVCLCILQGGDPCDKRAITARYVQGGMS